MPCVDVPRIEEFWERFDSYTRPSCKRSGRKCDGYSPLGSSTNPSKELSTTTAVTSSEGERRALEFFFHRTAPQLAGFFEGSFWKGSVLQLSLAEPAIRQAIAAIGLVHEQEGSFQLSPRSRIGSTRPDFAVQLYNRAIRSIIERSATDTNAIPIVVVASILFTCFEFFQRNSTAATTHVSSGINLLRTWRENAGGPKGPWGQRYLSFESHFIETELAPIISLFNINACGFGAGPRDRILLNAVDNSGLVVLADRFETLREARVGLVDLVTAAVSLFQQMDHSVSEGQFPAASTLTLLNRIRFALDRWKANFEDLTRRRQSTWDKDQKSAANAIRIMWHSSDIGITTYRIDSESAWDAHRPVYEEIVQLVDSLISDPDRYPDELSKTLSLDPGLIFPLHAVAWKCRWPDIRRKGLDLLLRIPKREWLYDASHYHAIFSRIMAIEEAHLDLPSDTDRDTVAMEEESMLPPEHVRIHDFYTVPLPPTTSGCCSRYAVTFMSKPNGLNKEWHFQTENLSLQQQNSQTGGNGEAVAPFNLLACKKWAMSDLTNPHTVNMLKSAVFGLQENFHWNNMS